MTINEIRKKVCIRANALHRLGMKINAAFKEAWAKYKTEATMTKASELKQGDVVSIDFGESGNVGKVTIISVIPSKLFGNLLEIKASNYGNEIDFCVSPTDLFKKVA